MPQVQEVVRCFSCETFQAQIQKKIKKWTCKICNEKQSLKKVYFTGSGADTRKIVMEYNMKRGEIEETKAAVMVEASQALHSSDSVDSQAYQPSSAAQSIGKEQRQSRWSSFLPDEEQKDSFESDDEVDLPGDPGVWDDWVDDYDQPQKALQEQNYQHQQQQQQQRSHSQFSKSKVDHAPLVFFENEQILKPCKENWPNFASQENPSTFSQKRKSDALRDDSPENACRETAESEVVQEVAHIKSSSQENKKYKTGGDIPPLQPLNKKSKWAQFV